MFGLIKVRGDSMSPALLDGDIVITIKPRTPRAGLIYVIDHMDLGTIIKRAAAIDGKGRLMLRGDNPASTPPAIMGITAPGRVRARAVFRLRRLSIARL